MRYRVIYPTELPTRIYEEEAFARAGEHAPHIWERLAPLWGSLVTGGEAIKAGFSPREILSREGIIVSSREAHQILSTPLWLNGEREDLEESLLFVAMECKGYNEIPLRTRRQISFSLFSERERWEILYPWSKKNLLFLLKERVHHGPGGEEIHYLFEDYLSHISPSDLPLGEKTGLKKAEEAFKARFEEEMKKKAEMEKDFQVPSLILPGLNFVRSPRELQSVADRADTCAASYAEACTLGKSLIYWGDSPEKTVGWTVEVNPPNAYGNQKPDTWRVCQAKVHVQLKGSPYRPGQYLVGQEEDPLTAMKVANEIKIQMGVKEVELPDGSVV